jgi:Zn-dependent peptidase ImmA (M78 family)/transcriptional regulator with XRE-family HTH domain
MKVIGENITIARESVGITQKKLSEAIPGLDQGNLSRMEKGLLPVSDEMVKKIAGYLDFPSSFFYKTVIQSHQSSMFYRKRTAMPQKQLSILESTIAIFNMAIDELLESVDIPEFKIPHIETRDDLSPGDIAFGLRNHLSLPRGPIENLIGLLEKNGIIIIFLDFDFEKFDGVTKFTDKSIPVIYINANMPGDRKRFTIAHEFGHLVMHLRTDRVCVSMDEDRIEDEANRFASEFMLPYVECKRDFQNFKYQNLPSYKYYWKMSKASIIRRANQIGCISDRTYQYFFQLLGRSGERKMEREVINIDSPSLLSKMTKIHLNELEYSMEELSDILGISKWKIGSTLLGEKNTPVFSLLF